MKYTTDDGVQVIGMSVSRPGRNDLIDHTLRHFVRGDFGALPPAEAMTVRDARWALVEEGVTERELEWLPCQGGQLAWQWWREPRRSCVQRIHDAGYWPRYLQLIREHPLPDAAQTPWRKGTRQRWCLVVVGRAVVWAKWRRGELRVTSAYRHILRDSRRAVSAQEALREQFDWALR